MTISLHRYFAPFWGAVLLVGFACNTQEIGPDPLLFPDNAPSANHGALQIAFAPREADFAAQQANAATRTTAYHVLLDGQRVAWQSDVDGPQPYVVGEGGRSDIGYLVAGSHHFEINQVGGSTVFAGDGELPAGLTTQLYLFGVAGAVQGRFVSYPEVPPAGTAHVSLINLIRTGQSVEAVACTDAGDCAPVSPPLALGETFAGDFPLDTTQDWPTGRFFVSNGAALGYRQVPTPTVPVPHVQPLPYVPLISVPSPSSATLLGAPVYMSPAGDLQESF